MYAFLIEFFDNSSIHGFRYFTERGRHWTERLCWIVVVVLSIGLCGSSIYDIWTNWNENPVTLSVYEKDIPISSIPFPTITICPQIKTKKDNLDISGAYFAWKNGFKNLTDTESKLLELVNHICQNTMNDFYKNGYMHVGNFIYNVLAFIGPSFQEIFIECKWRDIEKCTEMFSPVWTDEGFCFAFNALNSHELYTDNIADEFMVAYRNRNVSGWSPDHGYDEASDNRYPFAMYKPYTPAFYSYLLGFERDVDYECTMFQGFNIYLTMPGEVASKSRRFIRASLLEYTTVSMKPKLTTTSEKLRGYTPNRRGCFFNSERRLYFFKIYTQANCKDECLANFTKQQCGCVKFSMPRQNKTHICGGAKIECYQYAEDSLFLDDEGLASQFRNECNCLPACTTITYDAVTVREKFDYNAILRSQNESFEIFSGRFPSFVWITLYENRIEAMHRSALYTYPDFLSICGGLFGLYLAVSVLSIIEIVYYFSLRLLCTIRLSRAENAVVPFERCTLNSVCIDIAEEGEEENVEEKEKE